jgi:hypothetical protein
VALLRSRLPDKNRRDPRRRLALHPLAAAPFRVAFAAPRPGSRRLCFLTGQAVLALAAQFLQASADRREIVGSARTAHRFLPSDQAFRATPPSMMEAERAAGQTPAAT